MNKRTIEDMLLRVGIPANVKGFSYITQALLLIDTKEGTSPEIMALYAQIGKMNGSSASRVERAIRYAIKMARSYKGHQDVVNHYMGLYTKGNSAVLSQMHLMLKREEEDEKGNS